MRLSAHALLLLSTSLLFASCDKSRQSAENADNPDAPRVTKSSRSGSDQPPSSREKFKASIREAGAISSPEARNKALAEALWDVVDTDPEQARQEIDKLTPGSQEKIDLIQHFAMRLAEQDPAEAAQWAASLETEEEKSLAFGKIAIVVSATDPVKAAHLLSASGVAGREFDVAVVEVVQRWAGESPTDALAWATQFPPGESKTAAITGALGVWSVGDTQGAAAWVIEHPDPKVRQTGKTAIARALLAQPDMIQGELLQRIPPEMQTEFESLKAEAEAAEAAAAGQEE